MLTLGDYHFCLLSFFLNPAPRFAVGATIWRIAMRFIFKNDAGQRIIMDRPVHAKDDAAFIKALRKAHKGFDGIYRKA